LRASDKESAIQGKSASVSLLLMIFVSVIREGAYIFAPDPESLNPVDFLLFAVSIPVLTFGFRSSGKMPRAFIFSLVFFTFTTGFLGQSQLDNKLDLLGYVKELFPIIILILGLTSKLRLNQSQLKLLYLFICMLAAIAFWRTIGNSNAISVVESRHSTAYLLIGLILVVLSLGWRFVYKLTCVIFLMIPLLLLNVATGTIGLLVFLSLELANHYKLGVTVRVFVVASGVFAGIFSRVDLFQVRSSEVGLLGSGRVAAWTDGLKSFWQHDFYTQIFGQGSGSSFQFWGVWWWAQKDIHSDFLRVLIESGLLVFIILSACCLALYLGLQKINHVGASLLASAVVTGLISNGVLGRPYAAVLWSLAAIVARQSHVSKTSVTGDGVFEQPTLRRARHFQ